MFIAHDSTMRNAFLNAKIKTADVPKIMPLIDKADASIRCGAGIKRDKEWNAHLKLRTYQTLKAVGVMS